MPPGILHEQVSTALANWHLDAAESLLADVDADPTPGVAPGAPLTSLSRAWSDTLRAELLVRRLRQAGLTLLGDPIDESGAAAQLQTTDDGARSESAAQAAAAIALVRSARAAFDATDDELQRAAGLARHARIELLSRRVDAAMDEAVEAASLLDPALAPSPLLVHTLGALSGVLADLELMPLALDYQRRAHHTALRLAEDDPGRGSLGLVGDSAARLAALCAEVGEGLLDDGSSSDADPHFAEARALAEETLAGLPDDDPHRPTAEVVLGSAQVGLGEHAEAVTTLTRVVGSLPADQDRALLASAELALGRALRRQDRGTDADDHLARALALATEHGLPRLRRAALRELCTLHADLDDAVRALPYLQAYLADELDRVDERRTRWVELFGRRKSLLETERAAGQLRRQAYEDPLTHLPNRRYAEGRLDGLLAAGSAPALAVVDIDHFKSINDQAGHPGGDAVLRAVAQLLVDGVRDTDEVCRWAGDEFVILLPDTTAEQGERAMERIRASIATNDWSALGVDVPVTISVGIASAARGDDRRTLFAAADGVLYDAKRSGRDRVVRLSGVTQTRAEDGGVDDAPAPVAPVLEGELLDLDTAPVGDTSSPSGADTVTDVHPQRSVDDPAARTARPTDVLFGGPRDVPAPRVDDDHRSSREGERDGVDAPGADAAGGFGRLLVEPVPAPGGPRPQGGGRVVGPATRDDGAGEGALDAEAQPPATRTATTPGPDVVRGAGRSTEQVLALVREARRDHPDRPAVVVGASADTLVALASEHDAYTTMDHAAMAAAVGPVPEPRGRVAVLSAGAADAAVAAEAAFVARVGGAGTVRVDDVSGSRLRGLLADGSLLADVDCVVVVAGLDAALASTVAGLTDAPVVAVPTSTGQAGGFGGMGALLTMLNSSTAGVVVSPVDDGHAAGVVAARIARR
ncbi:diguanylate cyclase (GGDEF) domain-containing protein [Klenkia marina]|uniref:Diguanylate cyclase (GGDEF) domain-containing protein n=1 Tax=Klenkia marina TaxID=1960309 RepID=A0A1G4XHV2_9ACTN|nr:diguanylate cyclase [Klenkia marina]SCX40717.1 diguanylate cyclase (GGDEF) domain-containing protein [Klenkia marina]